MKKKKILYGLILCVFVVAGTILFPIGLQSATDLFVEWITQSETESEGESETETQNEEDRRKEGVSEMVTETATQTELQSETQTDQKVGLEESPDKTSLPVQDDPASVEYETDPPMPPQPDADWNISGTNIPDGSYVSGSEADTNTDIPNTKPEDSSENFDEEEQQKEQFTQGLEQARQEINISYSETREGNIEYFIGSRKKQFEDALSDYLYSTYEGFVEAERVDIVSFVEESEAELTYQIEVFATDGNSELFLCTYQKQIDAYGIYPLKDVTNREE